MQEINAWLQSKKDFEQGKALYLRYGTNTFFKQLLQNQGSTPYNIKKLGAELKELAPALPAKPQPVTKPVDPPTASGTSAEDQPARQDPKEYRKYLELKEVLKTRYKQLERNMYELDASKKESVTYVIARQIVALTEQIQEIWFLIDQFEEHGTFPTEKEEKLYTPAEQIQHLRVSNWKARKRIKEGCRDVKATEQLIEENNKKIIALGGSVK